VSRTAVRFGLDKRGATTTARPLDVARHNLSHGQYIVSVYRLSRHPVRGGPVGDVFQKTTLLPLRRERELIVLAHENHRQPPHRSQVHRLMGSSLIRRAVAEKDHGYPILPQKLAGERSTGPQGRGSPYYTVATQHAQREVRDVHGAPEAFAVACPAAQELGHHQVHARPLGEYVTVTAMMTCHVVVRAQHRTGSYRHSLLAYGAVSRSLYLVGFEQLLHLLLEKPDADHGGVELQPQVREVRCSIGQRVCHLPFVFIRLAPLRPRMDRFLILDLEGERLVQVPWLVAYETLRRNRLSDYEGIPSRHCSRFLACSARVYLSYTWTNVHIGIAFLVAPDRLLE
jgi:hypothetical protein